MLLPLLIHEVALHRKSATRDTSGGVVEGYAAVSGSTAIQCHVQANRGKAMRQLGQRQVAVSHSIYFAADPGWVRGDRFYWAAGAAYFTVHGVEDMGGQGRVWRAECSLLES